MSPDSAREGARTNWTDSVLEPASLSAHVVTIQRMSRNQTCSTDSQTVPRPKGSYGEVAMDKVAGGKENFTTSVLANPSAL